MATADRTAPDLSLPRTRDRWKRIGYSVPAKTQPHKIEMYLVPGYSTVYRERHLFVSSQVKPSNPARAAAAKKAAATKMQQTLEYASTCPIDVEVVSDTVIEETSRETYLGGYEGHREYPGFYPRQAVNCIRHKYTRYEEHLRWLDGRVATSMAYHKLKTRVLDAIARAYPHYADECYEQIGRLLTEEQLAN